MITRILAFILLLSPLPARAGEVQLLMFEEDGCYWCAKWNSELADIYPKTEEGRTAPLVRLDVHDSIPNTLILKTHPVYTPTFVVINDGQEVGRIEGYPGQDFFWGLLGRILQPLPEFQTAKDAS